MVHLKQTSLLDGPRGINYCVAMVNPKIIDDLARRLAGSVPAGVREFQQDLEKNLKAGLESAFTRLELVTREEFDVQRDVLARTRAKIDALERRVAELEAQLLPVAEGATGKNGEDNMNGG